jgi:tetrahydromethanopterin S-methyltransferase subunit F
MENRTEMWVQRLAAGMIVAGIVGIALSVWFETHKQDLRAIEAVVESHARR